MWAVLKLSQLAGALRRKGHAPETYAAVLELGRIGNPRVIDVLVEALGRRDGVARSAARELGRLQAERAVTPLANLLADTEVNQSAAEALVQLGGKAVPALLGTLRSERPAARRLAATALGDIGDRAAVDPLVQVLRDDPDWAVRTAAAAALGQLKDARAIWALVNTLKLRDEVAPERQAALQELREAAKLALRRIGDPLAKKSTTDLLAAVQADARAAVAALEQSVGNSELHPRLLGDLSLLANGELVSVLRELISASEESSWANVESRNPVVPPHFTSYEHRRHTAEIIGAELHRRGGAALLKQVLEQELNGHGALGNWWRESGHLA
jgi:HEAT repeat protein